MNKSIHRGNYRPGWLNKRIAESNHARAQRPSNTEAIGSSGSSGSSGSTKTKAKSKPASVAGKRVAKTWGTVGRGAGRTRSGNYSRLSDEGSALHTSIVNLFEQTIDNNNTIITNENWEPPRFRGSDLPFCGLRYALDYALKTGDVETTMKSFHTSTGHAIHETLQDWLGRVTTKLKKRKTPKSCAESGVFLGKYVCPVCKTLYPKGSKPEDNKVMLGPVMCDSKKHKLKKYLGHHASVPCRYHEINISGILNTAGFTGHCDGVILIDGKYLILEAKTTSIFSMQKKAKDGPYESHVLQSTAYRYLMPKFLGIPEHMFHDFMAVVYFYKGNINKHVVCLVPYEPKKFLDQVKMVKKAKAARKRGDLEALACMGICKVKEDAGFCRYAGRCFGSKNPHNHIMHCLEHGEDPD